MGIFKYVLLVCITIFSGSLIAETNKTNELYHNVDTNGTTTTYSTVYKVSSVSIHDKETMDDLKDSMGLESDGFFENFMIFMIKAENSKFEQIVKGLIIICLIIFTFLCFWFAVLLIPLMLFLSVFLKISVIYSVFICMFFAILFIINKYWFNNCEKCDKKETEHYEEDDCEDEDDDFSFVDAIMVVVFIAFIFTLFFELLNKGYLVI